MPAFYLTVGLLIILSSVPSLVKLVSLLFLPSVGLDCSGSDDVVTREGEANVYLR
jgi:hypothetical protein